MFSIVGIEAQHIAGEKNVTADYLSRAKNTNKLSSFSFKQFQTEFPWLTGSRHFGQAKSSYVSLLQHCPGHPWSFIQRECRWNSCKAGPTF
jgi:hypothetical protein